MAKTKRRDPRARALPAEAPPAPGASRDNHLEVAIGRQVRQFRQQRDMTVVEVAKQAGLSPGMLSKIENGMTSPSLATLSALAGALGVPVTSLFRKYEEQRDATFVKAGQGLHIERRARATSTSCSATRCTRRSRSSPTSSP
jgi:transcriptional regulator with XRE-family HTH domain